MNKAPVLRAAAASAAVVGLSLTPLAAHAATTTPTPTMDPATNVIAAGSASVDGPSTRYTTVYPREGGKWEYGVRGVIITDTYSKYYHPTKKHGSTASNGNGDRESRTANPKAWSDASVHHTFVGNMAFYRIVK